MIGDKVKPKSHHVQAAQEIFDLLRKRVTGGRPIITIAGESGSGKSEIAYELSKLYATVGKGVYIFQQDDYFFYPPKTNEAMRRRSIKHVGLGEVNLRLLDEHLGLFKQSPAKHLRKPLVIFKEDRISEEVIDPNDFEIGIAEGTYTSLLNHATHRIFIDRTYRDTYNHRMERRREAIDEFSEKILKIEHNIIAKHKSFADIIVNADYSVSTVEIPTGDSE